MTVDHDSGGAGLMLLDVAKQSTSTIRYPRDRQSMYLTEIFIKIGM